MDKNNAQQKFINSIKESLIKMCSFKCLDSLTDFNDCRETGLKKDKRLKEIKDEETKYYEITKGCYDEYQTYINCVKSVINELTDSKELRPLFENNNNNSNNTRRKHLNVDKEKFKEFLIKDFKLI